jgi:hypothetical protein
MAGHSIGTHPTARGAANLGTAAAIPYTLGAWAGGCRKGQPTGGMVTRSIGTRPAARGAANLGATAAMPYTLGAWAGRCRAGQPTGGMVTRSIGTRPAARGAAVLIMACVAAGRRSSLWQMSLRSNKGRATHAIHWICGGFAGSPSPGALARSDLSLRERRRGVRMPAMMRTAGQGRNQLEGPRSYSIHLESGTGGSSPMREHPGWRLPRRFAPRNDRRAASLDAPEWQRGGRPYAFPTFTRSPCTNSQL